MKFLLLYFFDEHAWSAMAPAERENALQRIQSWRREPAHAQPVLHTGELRGKEEVVTVFLGPAGHTESPQVVPGPFLQASEALGGYLVVEAADQDDAIALAKSWPTGGTFEIRPIREA
jgi:hypothetical protein